MKPYGVITMTFLAILTSACAHALQDGPAGLRAGAHEFVVDGVRLWYRVAGNPVAAVPPVVFLHGGPGQGSHQFAELVGPKLEPQLRMVYYDQRASGRSGRSLSGEYTLPMLVEDIEALRRALGVEMMSLIGHSFGGTLALEYASKYPQHVAGVVFAAGLWDVPYQSRLRCEHTLRSFPQVARRTLTDSAAWALARAGNCDWFWNLPNPEREALNNQLMFPDSLVRVRLDSVVEASGLRNTGELGGGLFRSGLLQYRFSAPTALTTPVLIIAGRHDGAAVPEGLRELANRLPDARFLEYEESGHFVYLDEPDRFARDVVSFFYGLTRN